MVDALKGFKIMFFDTLSCEKRVYIPAADGEMIESRARVAFNITRPK